MSLITTDELRRRLGDPGLRICDIRWWLTDPDRGRRDYAAGHIPGAIFVDVDRDLVAPSGPGRHPLPSPAAFLARLAALGIGDGHDVIAYDDAGGSIAARLWWMLDDLGHRSVRVLDGGIQGWQAAGGPLTTDVIAFAPTYLSGHDAWSRVLDRGDLAARLVAGDVALLDARATERYRGDIEPVDPMAGHIPGALSRPTDGNVAADGRFLEPAALRARFDLPGSTVVTSCGSGVTACHNALAMRIAGLPDPLLYPGSYSDWSTAGMPVATGDEPGRYRPGEG